MGNKKIEKKEKELGKSLEGVKAHQKMKFAKLKNDYIRNFFNGSYYQARYNMMVKQIHKGEIKEVIDGAKKTIGYMTAEAALMKMQAIHSHREAHFIKEELKKDFKLTDEDIEKLIDDYINGDIIRASYDDEYNKRAGKQAQFVSDTPENK